MTKSIILFDMDGVLLEQEGYHTALMAAVKRIGAALGMPNAAITPTEIARFEAMSVTNEWDSQSICAALMLIELWKLDGSIRYEQPTPRVPVVTEDTPDISGFLDRFTEIGDDPGPRAYQILTAENAWLDEAQRDYLELILFHTREIYTSPLLPVYQESVLGSQVFQDHYGLAPQLHCDSYLMTQDTRVMSDSKLAELQNWLDQSEHAAGILTNRPCKTPPGYLSSPEAEIGAQFVGLPGLPLMGSGTLAWFAETQLHVPDHLLFKPHALHALGLLQLILGRPVEDALQISNDLMEGRGSRCAWEALDGARITVIEDTFKGLACGLASQKALAGIDIPIHLQLIGVATHPEKRQSLAEYTSWIVKDLNAISWESI
jgi:phosphoglycolate phosphatase-like HAD superfamily hydrolase